MQLIQEIAKVLKYDPDTGVFIWIARTSQSNKIGGTAGGIHKASGYARISVLGKRFFSHRLAWALSYGVWPDGEIDHINGIMADNRLCNLRQVTTSKNQQNRRAAQSNSKTGLLGVSSFRGKWRAVIRTKEHRSLHIGTFCTPEEAFKAYLTAKRKMHEGCTI